MIQGEESIYLIIITSILKPEVSAAEGPPDLKLAQVVNLGIHLILCFPPVSRSLLHVVKDVVGIVEFVGALAVVTDDFPASPARHVEVPGDLELLDVRHGGIDIRRLLGKLGLHVADCLDKVVLGSQFDWPRNIVKTVPAVIIFTIL